MTTYTITVPKIGKYMSANDRPNRWAKAKATKEWRAAAELVALQFNARQGAGILISPVRITATVHIADKRRREVSNYFPTFKACIDGFVDAGVLVDDSDLHVVGPDPRRGYDKVPRIVFELEEVTPASTSMWEETLWGVQQPNGVRIMSEAKARAHVKSVIGGGTLVQFLHGAHAWTEVA